MHDTHQIEVTDEVTFFKLHDENSDGFWDENELKLMYGVERDVNPNSSHIKLIIDHIYDEMDVNKDRFISMDEYITSKLPVLTKKQEEAEVKLKKEIKIKKQNNNSKDQQLVIVNNKRKPSSAKAAKLAAAADEAPKIKVAKQKDNSFVPHKFRA